MIVAEVLSNQRPQVSYVGYDHAVQQFRPTTPHPSFGHTILPGTLIGRPDQFATHRSEDLGRLSLVLPVSIQDQVARHGVIGKSLAQLLHHPGACRMLRGVKVEGFPAGV